MVILENVTFANFLSVGNSPVTIELNKYKTTLITGTNGTGKSTVMDAICFALFNKPFRRINKPQLVNAINERKLLVELNMNVDGVPFKIIRGIKPAKFEIYKHGHLVSQEAANKDYQGYLEKQVMKMNFKTFTQIVMLGSANWTSFMSLPAAQRRNVIEDLLDIEIFSVMNSMLKDRFSDNKNEMTDIDTKVAVLENTIKLNEKHRRELEEKSKADIDSKLAIITEKQEMVDKIMLANQKLQVNLDAHKEKYSVMNSLQAKAQKLERNSSKIDDQTERLQKEHDDYLHLENCPTCTQKIDDELKQSNLDVIQSKLSDLNVASEKLNESIKELAAEIEALAPVQKSITEITEKMQELNMKMMVAQTTITNTQKDIKKINESIVEVADDTEEKRALKNHVLRRRQLTDERELYTVASMLLKDNGIKTQIIRQYIPIMNTMINKYLERMDFFVQFNLDENFNETIKARYKDVFSYDSFSQGEKARIDLALMLTWRAISQMRNTSPCNLLLLDEVFDGSLDDTGTSALANMLSELTKTNVVVISHTQDDEHFEKCIKVRKEKNFSQYGS